MKYLLALCLLFLSLVSTSPVIQSDFVQLPLAEDPAIEPSITESPVRFDNQKIIKINGLSRVVFEELLVTLPQIDVWSVATVNTNTEEAFMDREEFLDVILRIASDEDLRMLEETHMDIQILCDNVQTIIDQESNSLKTNTDMLSILSSEEKMTEAQLADWFTNYHPYEEIVAWYKKLAADYPDFLEYIPSIGKTHENRDIIAVRLTNKKSQNADKKPQIFYMGLQHAREWIGGSTVQYITKELILNYGKVDNVTYLLDNAEYVIVPIVNPDGYAYTWKSNRLWRKNRAKFNGIAYGTDLNRNWNDHWGAGGSSTNPNSEVFMGPSAASEPEVQAISKFYLENERIVGAIDYHCFSQLLLRPFGWSKERSPFESIFKQVGDGMRSIIRGVHGKDYTSERSVDLYVAAGAASDWFGGDQVTERFGRTPIGFTIELRPKSMFSGGFVLSPKEIIPVGEEIFPAALYFSMFALEHPALIN